MGLHLLDEIFKLPRSDIYRMPAADGALLPFVYGDFTTDGALQTILIDAENYVYEIAHHAIDSVAQVFVGDEEVTEGYHVETGGTFEDAPVISYVTFPEDPGDDVYVRCQGRQFEGTYISNYVQVLEAILLDVFGLARSDLDSETWTRSIRIAGGQSYTASIRIDEERTPAEWLAQWLQAVNGSAWVDDGRLFLEVDDGTGDYNDVFTLNDGEFTEARLSVDRQNLYSMFKVDFAWDARVDEFVGSGFFFTGTWPNLQLVEAGVANDTDARRWYGDRELVISGREIRTQTHATNLATALRAIYKQELEFLEVIDTSRKTLTARPWDAIRIDASAWHHDTTISTRNWRIVGKRTDPRTGWVHLRCVDTRTHN